jgi:hypothetical protein
MPIVRPALSTYKQRDSKQVFGIALWVLQRHVPPVAMSGALYLY